MALVLASKVLNKMQLPPDPKTECLDCLGETFKVSGTKLSWVHLVHQPFRGIKVEAQAIEDIRTEMVESCGSHSCPYSSSGREEGK